MIAKVGKFFGEKLFWRLLKTAMWIGGKAFKEKFNARTHAIKSRRWVWSHVWLPMIRKAQASETLWDDPAVEFLYYYQVCSIEEGKLREALGRLQARIVQNTSSNEPADPNWVWKALEDIHTLRWYLCDQDVDSIAKRT